jgi:hypothetical protein
MHGVEQEIRLVKVLESRPIRRGIWIAGKGGAIINNGSSYYFWKSQPMLPYPQLEIELPSANCAKVLSSPIPADKAIAIVGMGVFRGTTISGAYLGKFVLESVSKCELVPL